MEIRLLPLAVSPLAWLAAPALAQDYFCYMVNPAGQAIDMGHLCGVPGSQPPGPVAPASGPVIGGNELVPAVLEFGVSPGGATWVTGNVGNRGPVGITVQAIAFDVLDSGGQIIYQGTIIPTGGSVRVPAGAQRRVSTFASRREMAGEPASVVATEIRYVR